MTLHIGSMMPDRSLDQSVLIIAITKVATEDAIDAAGKFFSEHNILSDLPEHLALVEVVIPKACRNQIDKRFNFLLKRFRRYK
jgi:hypothetical protein